MPADGSGRFVEPERRPGVGTMANDEQSDTRRQLGEIVLELVFGVRGCDRRKSERRFVAHSAQGRATRRAEPGILGVLVAAACAKHECAGYRRCGLDLNLRLRRVEGY